MTSNIQTGTTYQFSVLAANVHGPGPLGTALSVVAAGLPGVPTSLQAVSTSATSLTFSWTAPTDTGGVAIDDYEVYKETSAGSGIWTALARTGGPTSYTATGLAENTAYSFRVAAVNAAGTGDTTTTPFSMTTGAGGGGGGGGNLTL